MRSMIASLSLSINKVSEIDKKISKIDNKEPEIILLIASDL